MTMAAAMVGSAVVGGVSSFLGASKQEKAAKKSAALQKDIYNSNKAMIEPYVKGGENSFKLYLDAIGANGPEAQAAYYQNMQTDPGYEDANDFALEGIDRQRAARGSSLGGNTMAALYEYGQKNRMAYNQQQLQNQFAGAQVGTNAAGTLTGAGQNYANATSNAFMNQGNAQAAGITGIGSAINYGIGNYTDLMGRQAGYGAGVGGATAGGI